MDNQKSRLGTNWEAELRPEETAERKENNKTTRVVLLRGLQRLAQMAGLVSSNCEFKFYPLETFGIMQCVYTAQFSDNTQWVGAADCNGKNTDKEFLAYPSAVAESRAEARALKKALGIAMLSAEEVGFNPVGDVTPAGKIDAQVIKAIEKLCANKNIPPAEVLENTLTKERAQSIFQLEELTVQEGHAALEWLNEQKVKVIAKTEVEKRNERKQALLAKKGQS